MAYTAPTRMQLHTRRGTRNEKMAPEFEKIADELAAIRDAPRALANGHLFVGSAEGVAADVAMSGDMTIANTGAVTIAAAAVTLEFGEA